ncbi:MAG: PAS domain S-box protein, partial [Methanobacterium sp.]
NISVFNLKKDLIGFNGLNAVYPEDRERIKRCIKNLLLNGLVKDVEYKILNKEGKVFPVEISATVIFDDFRKPYAVVCVLKDISRRKKAEEALKEARDNLEIKVKERTGELEEAYKALIDSEEKFRELFNNANDVITLGEITKDGIPGKFIEVNEAAMRKYGYSKDELLNMTPLDIIQKDIDNAPPNALKIFDTGSTKFETVHIAKDGSKIPVEVNTHLFNLKGKDVILGITRDITERKKAEEKSQEIIDFQQTLIDTIPSPIFYKDTDGIYRGCNKAYEEFLGLKKEYIVGKSVYDIFPKDQADKYYEKDLELFQIPGKQIYEWKMDHADGSIHSVIFNKATYLSADGTSAGLVGVMADITDRKKLEEELKDSEAYYRTIFENTGTASFIIEDDFIISLVNDECEELSGYSKEEIEGNKKWQEFVSPEFIAKMENYHNIRRINPELAPRNYEFEFMDRFGNKKTVTSTIAMIPGTKKSLVSLLDITERKELENRSIERSRRLNILNKIIIAANRSNTPQSLFEDVLDLTLELMSFDGGGIYLVNEDTEVASITYHKGLPIDFVKTVDNIPIDEYPFSKVFIHGKSMFMDRYDKLRPEYSKWNLKSGASIPLYSKDKIVGTFNIASKKIHEFTIEEKRLINSIGREIGNTYFKIVYEEELKNLIEDLKRSKEELEQFAFITSHDLQEPLRTIVSFTQLLEMRYKGKFDSDADEFMEYMVDASIRMKEMIQGLLNYSRIGREGIEFKPVNLENVLDETISSLELLIKENDALITYDKLPSVNGDSKLLVQLFQNLISNAIKFKGKENPE